MAAQPATRTHKITTQCHLVTEISTIFRSVTSCEIMIVWLNLRVWLFKSSLSASNDGTLVDKQQKI